MKKIICASHADTNNDYCALMFPLKESICQLLTIKAN